MKRLDKALRRYFDTVTRGGSGPAHLTDVVEAAKADKKRHG